MRYSPYLHIYVELNESRGQEIKTDFSRLVVDCKLHFIF